MLSEASIKLYAVFIMQIILLNYTMVNTQHYIQYLPIIRSLLF